MNWNFEDGASNGYMSTSGFPENDYDEPDDSDQVYYDTWEEAEVGMSLNKPAATTKPQGTTRSK